MTGAELEAAARQLVAKWQPRLGLENWHIAIEAAPKMDGAMRVGREPGYQKVLISVNPKVGAVDLRPEEIEYNVVHELVHLVLGRFWEFAAVEFDVRGLLWSAFVQANESCADAVASIVLRAWAGREASAIPACEEPATRP